MTIAEDQMDMVNNIVAMVHDHVGDALTLFLRGGERPFFIKPADTLVGQMEDPKIDLPRISAGLVGDVAVSSASIVLNRLSSAVRTTAPSPAGTGLRLQNLEESLTQVRSAVRGQLQFLGRQGPANRLGRHFKSGHRWTAENRPKEQALEPGLL
jgi:hypothetical protein